MADEAVQALTFDARGAQKGAAEFVAASEKTIDAVKRVEKVFSPMADAADRATRRVVTGTSEQEKFLSSLSRKYDQSGEAVRRLEVEMNRLSGIMAGTGPNAQRAAQMIGLVEQKLRDAQRAASSVQLDNAFRGVGRAAEEAARQSNAAWANIARGVSTAAEAQTAAVKRNYDASLQASRVGADELATRLKVKQAYEASLAPVAQLTAATERGAIAATGMGTMSRATAAEMKNLGFQINDVVSGLAMGQRPMQIFVQQGGQIAQLTGALRYSFGLLVSPIGLAAAGVTAVVGAMVLAISRAGALDAQLRALKTTLAATGGASGISAAALQSAAIDFARQPGVSRDTATQAAQGLASNPLLNADLLRRALPVVRDFAVATGKEIPDAAKAMATALTGGYAAAKQLDAQFQILSVAELNQIRNLEEQGRKGEAANIVLAAMQRQWKGLADGGLTEAAKAANSFGNAWDHLMDRLAKSGPIQFARDQLIGLLKAAGGTTDNQSRTATSILGTTGPIGQGIVAFLSAVGLAGSPAQATTDNTAAGSIAGGIAAISRAADPATAALDKLSTAAAGGKGALHNLGIEADTAAKALDPAGRELERLGNLQALLTSAMVNGKMAVEDYAKSMALLGIAMSQVQTPDNILAQLQQQATRAGMGPSAGAGYDAAERVRLAGGTQEQQDEARRLGQRIYGAGQGSGLGEQIAGIRAGAGGSAAVIAAYAQSTEAGRRAEIELKALEAQYKNGAAAVRAYADALLAQDAAQRRVEGARDLAKLKDDIADTERLNAALAESTAAYEREKIAIEAAARVRQGYLTPAQAADYTTTRLRALTQEYERQAIALTRQLDPVARLNDELKTLAELQATGKLSAKAFQEAMTDAYIQAGQASDSFIQGATAGLLEYARQAQQVGSAMADAVLRAFGAADDAIAKLLLRRSVDLRQFLADASLDLTRAFVRQTITGPIAGFLGGLFTGGGSAGGSAQTISIGGVQFAPVGGASAGGGFNPFGMLGGGGGGGFNPFGVFGQNGSLGSWLSSPISGFPSAAAFEGVIPGMSGSAAQQFISGASGGGLFNTLTWGQGLGALAGVGSGIFQLATGGGSLSSIIGGAGSLIGAGVSLIPGVGQIAGPIISIASTILGSLFKSKPFPEAQGWHTYNPATGGYTGRATFERGGMTAPIATGIGNDALKLIGAFGGSVAPGAAAPDYYIWKGYEAGKFDATVTAESSPTYRALLEKAWASGQVKTTEEAQWAARTELWTDAPVNGEWRQLPINAPTQDSEKLMQQLALLILKAGVRDNAFTGLSGTSQTIIRNFPDADTQGLAEALQWGKQTYDTLLRGDTITAAEKALTDLKDSFTAAIAKAKDLGLATDGLAQAQTKAINKYAADFGQNIEDAILGLNDPAALQRVQIERAREQALKEWDYLNEQYLAGTISTLIDRNKINELYDQQLVQVTNQALSGLMDLQRRLLYGDLSGASPAAAATGASATYSALLAQARAGDATALANLSGAGADYVSSLQAAYGHTAQFASGRDKVLADIATFLGGTGVTAGASANGNSEAGQTVAMLTVLVQTQAAQLAAALESVARLTDKLDRAA